MHFLWGVLVAQLCGMYGRLYATSPPCNGCDGWRWAINRMDPPDETLEFDHGGHSKHPQTMPRDPCVDCIIPCPAPSPLIWSKSPNLFSNEEEWEESQLLLTQPPSPQLFPLHKRRTLPMSYQTWYEKPGVLNSNVDTLISINLYHVLFYIRRFVSNMDNSAWPVRLLATKKRQSFRSDRIDRIILEISLSKLHHWRLFSSRIILMWCLHDWDNSRLR
jgi:hypothetical protein